MIWEIVPFRTRIALEGYVELYYVVRLERTLEPMQLFKTEAWNLEKPAWFLFSSRSSIIFQNADRVSKDVEQQYDVRARYVEIKIKSEYPEKNFSSQGGEPTSQQNRNNFFCFPGERKQARGERGAWVMRNGRGAPSLRAWHVKCQRCPHDLLATSTSIHSQYLPC